MKKVQVQLRLPTHLIHHIKRVAKAAGVTPTQVYNVMMALAVLRPDAAHPPQEKK